MFYSFEGYEQDSLHILSQGKDVARGRRHLNWMTVVVRLTLRRRNLISWLLGPRGTHKVSWRNLTRGRYTINKQNKGSSTCSHNWTKNISKKKSAYNSFSRFTFLGRVAYWPHFVCSLLFSNRFNMCQVVQGRTCMWFSSVNHKIVNNNIWVRK